MRHIVSLSGGMGSAIAAERVIQREGKDVTLWFADTKWEDPDLYRFLDDLERRWGIPIIRHTEGETPLEVSERRRIIPNSLKAPCTFALKIEPFVKFLEAQPKPLTVYIGIAWWEKHRTERPKARYEAIPGVTCDFPLLWKPLDYTPPEQVIRSWKPTIEPPRLYSFGMPHNNCGGACVKQGKGEWLRLLSAFPERYAEVEQWEAKMRAKGGGFTNRTICKDETGGTSKPISLRELRQRFEAKLEAQPPLALDEQENCLCSVA